MMKKRIMFKSFASVIIVLAVAAVGAGQADEAIEAIRLGGTPDMSLERARSALIDAGSQYVDRIVDVLIEGGVNVSAHARINFAIVLSQIARNQDTARLREGLLICTNDTNPGVRLIGIVGLNRIADFPEEDFAPVLVRLMGRGQPRHIRLKAAEVAVERNMLSIAPEVFDALRRTMPAYESVRNQAVLDMVGGRIERAPDERMPFDDFDMYDYDMYDDPRMMFPGPGPGPRPGTRPMVTRERPLTEMDLQVDEITSEEALELISDYQENIELLQALANRLEEKPEVSEVRRIGNALERMTEDLRDDDDEWGFLTRAPWELDQLTQTVLGWFEQHRNQFE